MRCVAKSRKCSIARTILKYNRCEDANILRRKQEKERWWWRRRISFHLFARRNENDAKTTATDLTRKATAVRGIRECNESYATIKPECRGAPRPQETPKFSSIFLSQKGRVGVEDAFAKPTILMLLDATDKNDTIVRTHRNIYVKNKNQLR